ncbi:hypothetical protein [Paracerasibacillus soli]|uniref:Uncharacterized protein n=1 Tax=Paracerasibacillus soli TaxID=480284 RepID=A0ABU5CR94_9BACI|nr:hypothetical protein [Virgibacillus soli]MDY0408891.1 hypothetical protein [Virgibacillus soli]
MTKPLKNWWGRLLFQDSGIVPSKRLLIGYAIFSICLIVLGRVTDIAWSFIFLLNMSVILASFIDLFFIPRKRMIGMKRVLPGVRKRYQLQS